MMLQRDHTNAAVVLASLLVSLPFCRWLCPLAAVLNPLSRVALTRIRRSVARISTALEELRALPVKAPHPGALLRTDVA